MWKTLIESVNLRLYATFILTFISIIGALGLAYFKDVDIVVLLPSILGIYVSGQSVGRVSAQWAASKDGTADTQQVIKDTGGV